MKLLLLFAYISILSAFIPTIAGLVLWKQLPRNLKLILLVSVISLIADGISFILIRYGVSTWPVLNLFYTIQLTVLFTALAHQRPILVLRIIFYACICFAVLNFFFIQTPKTFNTYTAYVGGILMIISSISFLYQLMNEMPVEKVQTLPMFWLAFGVLVYYGGTLFLFLFNNYLISHLPKSHQIIWALHNALNIIKNVFLFISLWINYKSRTSPL